MPTEGFKRKLTAILSADVVGYSRLMGEDEESTVKILETYKGVMSTLINEHRGRVVDSPGDNLLAEFGSVVDAVQCAVAVQKELQARNEELPENRRMLFRIGINLGDVIEEKDRLYGDGVNIAARLEALAEPGSICISKIVFDQIENKVPLNYRFLGEQEVKNIAKPIGAYKVLLEPKVIETKRTAKKDMKAASSTDKPSIAVLPFVNISGDPEQEYFSDGMTEELIGALAKLEGLKVISRTSAFYFKGKDVDLRTIGEKLKVDNVLEGSVRKAGNRLRISAQLIKVDDDTHLWSENYNRELKDVFDIQEEISQAIVQNLKVAILGGKAERLVKDYTKNTEAYELFLKGCFFEGKGFYEYEKSIEYLEKAIKADPEFAPAFSRLALINYVYATQFSLPPNEIWPKVKTLVLKALEIDKVDVNAHAMMGRIKSCYDYDWVGAEVHFKRAIELNPGYIDAHSLYALYLIGVGRADEAIKEMQLSLELDPLSITHNGVLSIIFYFARRFDKAITQSHKTLELAPSDPLSLEILGLSHVARGMYDKGINILQQVRNIPLIRAELGCIYGKADNKEEAQKILDDLLIRAKQGYFSPSLIAAVYTGLGNKNKAFKWLERAFEERDFTNWCIKEDPRLEDLHSDPRWTRLMERMGLAN